MEIVLDVRFYSVSFSYFGFRDLTTLFSFFGTHQLGRDLDNEVVRTEAKSLRDLKMGITGCPSPQKGKMAAKSGGTRALAPDEEKSKSLVDNENMSNEEVEKQGIAEATLRLMKMVDDLESAQKDGTANLDAGSKCKSDNDDNNENDSLAKLEVDTSLQSLSRMSTLGSDTEPVHQEPSLEDPAAQMYVRSDSFDQYEKSFKASKDTLSSAKDFLKELSNNDSTEEKADS